MRTALIALVLLAACKDEPGSYDDKGNPTEPAKPAPERANVNVLKPPVEYGKKIPCATLLPDVAKLGAALGKEVVLDDKSGSDAEANSVCQVKLAGTPPTKEEQDRMFEKNNRVLGTLPGDELCQITAYCSFVYDKDELRKKCDAAGEKPSSDIGDLTCVKMIEAGPDYRYIYTVLDTDSKCKLLVNPGPSVIEEERVKTCARAAADLISPATLKVP